MPVFTECREIETGQNVPGDASFTLLRASRAASAQPLVEPLIYRPVISNGPAQRSRGAVHHYRRFDAFGGSGPVKSCPLNSMGTKRADDNVAFCHYKIKLMMI